MTMSALGTWLLQNGVELGILVTLLIQFGKINRWIGKTEARLTNGEHNFEHHVAQHPPAAYGPHS